MVDIGDIQRGTWSEGTVLTVEAIATATSADGFFLQEPAGGAYSGIWIAAGSGWETAFDSVVEGDEVRIKGVYFEDGPRSTLDLQATTQPELVVLARGGVVPSPSVLTADALADPTTAEMWEGVLVSLTAPVVDETRPLDDHFTVTDPTWTWDVEIHGDIFALPALLTGDLVHGEPFIAISGPVDDLGDHYAVLPRQEDDCVYDGVTPMAPGGTEMIESVFDIQQGMVAEGSLVEARGLCLMAMTDDGAWVQSALGGEYSAIYVYLGPTTDLSGLSEGDIVDVVGETLEFYGESRIDASLVGGIEVVGNVSLPASDSVSAADLALDPEPWEGVLIAVAGLTVTVPLAGTGEFAAEDASGNEVRIDDRLYRTSDFDTLAVGDSFAAVVGHWSEAGGVYRLQPREEGDLIR